MSGQVFFFFCDVVCSLLLVLKHKQLAVRPRNSYILTAGILQVLTGVCQRVQPSQLIWRLRPITRFQKCFTPLLWLPRMVVKKKKKKKRSSTNNLGVVSRHSSSAKQSQAGWAVGKRGERHLGLSGPAHPAGEWQHINKSAAASTSCDAEPEQSGSVLHPPNQPRSRTQTWAPR